MVEDYMLHKVLGKIKMIIGTKKIHDTKNLMKTDVKLPNDIALKKSLILIICAIEDRGNFYPKIILVETSVV